MISIHEQRMIDSCALRYYHKNKERINEQRASDRIAKAKGTYAKRLHPSKTGDLISRRQGAILMGISQHKLTNIVSRTTRFTCKETITLEGRVMYKVKDLLEWKSHNLDLFEEGQLVEAGTCKLSPHVMLLINWGQKTKRISNYCDRQRVAINSKNLWGKYA